MKKSDFYYPLPDELIAQTPCASRSGSRMLHLASDGALTDRQFKSLPDLLRTGDLLILNNTKVLRARLHGRKPSGGVVEIMLERVLGKGLALAQVKASKSPKPGTELILTSGETLHVVERRGAMFVLKSAVDWLALMESSGNLPLPPYISRGLESDQAELEELDEQRYQTLYASKPGAVAAPTAGLHFDEAVFDAIRSKGVTIDYLTLHVGAGTYQPVRAENITDHAMHSEWFSVDQPLIDRIQQTRNNGGRIVAVGTTVVRSLETLAMAPAPLTPYEGDTRIFLYPGKPFNLVDAMITNFHLPESTLLMLVAAFAGYRRTLSAYEHAVRQAYRFFSYGDAMFIERNPAADSDLP